MTSSRFHIPPCARLALFLSRVCVNVMKRNHSLLGRGLYALQLAPWLEAFSREQIKVVFLEEMVQVGGEGRRLVPSLK